MSNNSSNQKINKNSDLYYKPRGKTRGKNEAQMKIKANL